MSDADAYQDEMARLTKLSEQDLDRILAGRAPVDMQDPAEDLAEAVRSLREGLLTPPSAPVEQRHLAAIVETSLTLAQRGERSAPPSARDRAPRPLGLPTLRRKLMPAGVFASLTAKIAGVAVAAAVATGGLAASSALPGPAHDVVMSALGGVEVTVHDGGGDHDFSPAPLEEDTTASEHASDTAMSVLAVVDGWLAGGYATGCEFGRAVAAAAGADTSGAAECPTPGSNGEEASAAGKAKGEEASAAGKAKGEEASAAGKAKGEEASSSASSSGIEKAEGSSSAGTAKGSEAAESGTSNNPTGKP